MNSKRKTELPHGDRRPRPPISKHYECPQGWAYLETGGTRLQIRLLLDSGSNIFLLNEKLVHQFEIPYEVPQKAIDMVAFDGVDILGRKKVLSPDHFGNWK